MQNPLLKPFDLPPFTSLQNEHYLPSFVEAIAAAKAEISAIIEQQAEPSFENTVEKLDFSGIHLDRIASLFFTLHSSDSSDEFEKIAMEVSPMLTDFHNDILLNQKLFEKIKFVYDKKKETTLTPEQTTLLEKTYKNFTRNGALLNEVEKETLRELDKELGMLSLTFGNKLLKDTNLFEWIITDEKELDGLPADNKLAAKEAAKAKGKEGWLFTLQRSVVVPFLNYISNREIRRKMWLANGCKGFQANENNTEESLLKIAKLKIKKANLLGFKTFADFILEERMAKTVATVRNFQQELFEKSSPFVKNELAELTEFAKQKDGLEKLESWDVAYYSEQLKKEKFNFEEELLRPYFKLENVLEGVFNIAGELYNLTFTPAPNVAVYHAEVKAFEVHCKKTGKFIAHLFTDFFPRPSKRSGAWMTSFKSQCKQNGKDERPQIAIVCNFTKPTETKPSLLAFNEVTTLFHEFGHALHGMLSEITYPSLSGTNVLWDFVELPSQIFENWCFEKEALDRFAKHYETGEILPDHLIQKINDSSTFQAGMNLYRQLSLGMLDFGWHAVESLENVNSIKAHEKEIIARTQLFTDYPTVCISPAFAHIFQGGYSAGYYSYKWAEVLDADAFEYFEEKGIFSQEVATKFKENVLSKGASAHPMELYIAFRGKEPSINALLKRSGLN